MKDWADMKLLFFHNTLPEYRIAWFCRMAEKCQVKYVFTNEKLNKMNYGVDIDYGRAGEIDSLFLEKGSRGMWQLWDILRDVDKYDFVELPPIDSFRDYRMGRMICMACRKSHVKIGYFWEKWEAPHAYQPLKRKVKNLILRVIPKLIYKNADVIFAAGTKSKEYFIDNKISERKIHILPDVSETPECDYEDIRVKYGISADKKLLLYLGRMIPQKGVNVLIQAFSLLDIEDRKKFFLLIAGGGDYKAECEKLATELKIKNIAFAGAISPEMRGNYFSQCDIFIYPVTYRTGWVDVWGLTLNEAIQHGKVVIATDAVGSAYDLIEEGVNGYRVKAGDVRALAQALEMANDEKIKNTAIKKDNELRQYYSYENMANAYLKVVKSALEADE